MLSSGPMRVLLQRSKAASVEVNGQVVGAIDHGLVALVGIARGDGPSVGEELARKTAHLRIFADEAGKTNLDIRAVSGQVLVVSQFTLCASTKKGHRPSFNDAAPPELAEQLVALYEEALGRWGVPTASGRFGASMAVSLINDGPFTILLEKRSEQGSA